MLHLREDGVMSAEIHYQRLNADNFTGYSLDDFVRHQSVTESWRKKAGDWKLVPNVYEENWSLPQKNHRRHTGHLAVRLRRRSMRN